MLHLFVESIEDSSSQAMAAGFLGSSANSSSDDALLQDSFCSGACREDSPSELRRQRSAGSNSAHKCSTGTNSMSRTRRSSSTAAATAAAGCPQGGAQQMAASTSSSSSRRVSAAHAAGGGGSSSCASTLLPEVIAYDEFVVQHGPTGGWHPDDHNTFVALLRRSRYILQTAALLVVAAAVPHLVALIHQTS
jgi:hypothetical protein